MVILAMEQWQQQQQQQKCPSSLITATTLG